MRNNISIQWLGISNPKSYKLYLFKKIMADSDINVPSGLGGLLRFKEEYDSYLKLKPIHVIGFIILIIAFVIILNIFFPITSPTA